MVSYTLNDDLGRVAPEVAAGIRVLPVIHDRIEMTAVVRPLLERLDPAGVALELPTTLAAAVKTAVARLPRISLVLSEEQDEGALIWVCAPGDPFAEAARWAGERGRELFFIDPDLPYRDRHADPIPDPYSLLHVGPWRYLAPWLEASDSAAEPAGASAADQRREAGMAFHLRAARRRLRGEILLALVGAGHVRRLRRRLREPVATPLARVQRRVEVLHLHPNDLTALLPDPPLAHAVYDRLRRPAGGDRPAPATPSSATSPAGAPTLAATVSRPLSLVGAGLRMISRRGPDSEAVRGRRVVDYASHHGTTALPGAARETPPFPDRWALARVVWAVAAASYRSQTREELAHWQRRTFFDFAYRYARAQGQLVPGLFEWTVAGRGVADDNLAWEIFEAARAYPDQQPTAEIPTVRVDGSELDLGTRRIRFRRRFFRVKQRPVAVPVRPRPRLPDDPLDWLRGFDGDLCSYPPEDLVIEDYGRFLRVKAGALIAAERQGSEPFTTSLLDGIDLRETLRRRAGGDRDAVWVRTLGRWPGRAGSLVLLFDPDLDGTGYPYLMTWLGEHEAESDMAFYSTDPAQQIVGPGILRATYGGLLMTMPPGRLYDVWNDADYGVAADKAEVLVMAAIDYSLEPLVAHVAPRPPSAAMRGYASHRGKRLVHVPLGSLSRRARQRIRVLHILSGRDKREIAPAYLW